MTAQSNEPLHHRVVYALVLCSNVMDEPVRVRRLSLDAEMPLPGLRIRPASRVSPASAAHSRGACGLRLASLRRTRTSDKAGTTTHENVTHAANHFIALRLSVGIRYQKVGVGIRFVTRFGFNSTSLQHVRQQRLPQRERERCVGDPAHGTRSRIHGSGISFCQ